MNEYGIYGFSDFDSYSNGTRDFLYSLHLTTDNFYLSLGTPEFIISLLGILLNIFHLIILTRKAMRTSSINVFMTGIAICDLFIMIFNCHERVLEFILFHFPCTPTSNYTETMVDLWANVLKEDLRRVSAWLGVAMAFVRLLIMKNSLNPKYGYLSRPSFGWKSTLVILVLSSILSACYSAKLKITESDLWFPADDCSEYPANYTEVEYSFDVDAELLDKALVVVKVYFFVDAMLKIIPAFVLPILTCFLIRELKLVDSNRQKITVTSHSSEKHKKDHTTILVVIITVTFFLSEGPVGIILLAQVFLNDKPGFLDTTYALAGILNIFVPINATTHCLICITMSTQYQNCVMSLFCCRGKSKTVRNATKTPKPRVSSALSVRNVVVEL